MRAPRRVLRFIRNWWMQSVAVWSRNSTRRCTPTKLHLLCGGLNEQRARFAPAGGRDAIQAKGMSLRDDMPLAFLKLYS
ncbi:protein of unknown function [Pararobbsia alpina]